MHGKKVVHCIKPCIKQLPVTETYVYLPDTTGCHLDFIEYSRRTGERKDYIHFLFIARGAAYEAEAQLIACADLELIDRNTLKSLYSQTVKVIHLFNALIKALKKVIPIPCQKELSAMERTTCQMLTVKNGKSIPKP